MSKKPHILIFNPDQWRADVMGHLGNSAAVTPFLDEWVETEAVSFAYNFCQAPVCTPSRCSFLTGQYPHVFGHRSLHHMLHAERGQTNLFKVLRDNGYFVWWGGKNDVIPAAEGLAEYADIQFKADEAFFARHASKPRNVYSEEGGWRGAKGSDTFYSFLKGPLIKDPDDRYFMDGDWQNILGAIDFIKSAPTDQPLCIYLPIIFPHPPYCAEPEFLAQIDPAILLPPRRIADQGQFAGKPAMLHGIRAAQNLTGWSEDRWDELRRTYYAMVARVDQQFRMVVEALKDACLYDETAIFMFSDHGDYTGDYGIVEKSQNTFEDPLTRVPLVVKLPADASQVPGVRDRTITELIDVPATIYDLAGVDPGYDHFGRSLRGAIADPDMDHRDTAHCEGGRRIDEMQVSEVESLAAFGPDPSNGLYFPRINVQITDGAAHNRAVMIRSLNFKYVRRLNENDEFYDLREDPQELDNRIDQARYGADLAHLKEKLLTWYLDTSDIVPRQTDARWLRHPEHNDNPPAEAAPTEGQAR